MTWVLTPSFLKCFLLFPPRTPLSHQLIISVSLLVSPHLPQHLDVGFPRVSVSRSFLFSSYNHSLGDSSSRDLSFDIQTRLVNGPPRCFWETLLPLWLCSCCSLFFDASSQVVCAFQPPLNYHLRSEPFTTWLTLRHHHLHHPFSLDPNFSP